MKVVDVRVRRTWTRVAWKARRPPSTAGIRAGIDIEGDTSSKGMERAASTRGSWNAGAGTTVSRRAARTPAEAWRAGSREGGKEEKEEEKGEDKEEEKEEEKGVRVRVVVVVRVPSFPREEREEHRAVDKCCRDVMRKSLCVIYVDVV